MSTIAVKKIKLGDNVDLSKNFLIEVPAVADGTLTIKRESGTAVLSIDANGKAVIPGVVGTVAQVGGIPTGQVVERGSNANGAYVRFADGTQMCLIILTPFSTTEDTNWTYPAEFADASVHIYGVTNGSGTTSTYVLGLGNPNATSAPLRNYSVTVGGATARSSAGARLFAIGRWF